VDTDADVVTLWRPTGPEELALVEASGWREWPPRLPDQPIFYPVLNQEYATRIARDWNVKYSGHGYVTRFGVRRSFLDGYEVQQAGGRTILEYWIPAEDLGALNASIVGLIEVVDQYPRIEDRQVELLAVVAEGGGDRDARRIDLSVSARLGPGEGTVLSELEGLARLGLVTRDDSRGGPGGRWAVTDAGRMHVQQGARAARGADG